MMSKNSNYNVKREGAFVVRAAESPSSRVRSKTATPTRAPSIGDKRLARAVLKHKSAS